MRRLTRWTLWAVMIIAAGACAHDKSNELSLENCADGADNNGNNLVDCADPLCGDSEECLGEDRDPTVAACGDGLVSSPERCDTAIPAGSDGACPTGCEPPDACTTATLLHARSCEAQCTFSAITSCEADDGCCPAGCDAAVDGDCNASCGNGVVEGSERCDIDIASEQAGACPSDCDDDNACTADVLNQGGSCAAHCTYPVIETCSDADGCCPSGCHADNDDDCSPTCGNGVVEAPERCDIEIPAGQPGACPADCDDGNACTTDSVLNRGTCGALCLRAQINRCADGDGCCPAGCHAGNDDDCSPTCGNGVVEAPERCDTRIPAGQQGACLSRCDDGKACTTDTLLNGGTCAASCVHGDISSCNDDDGCCPAGCNAENDGDCSPSCGNGVVESPERCDTRVPAGQQGACPTACDDGEACTADVLINGGTCGAACVGREISQCTNDDGCCPGRRCNATNDNDCDAICGNGVVEPGERCDTRIPAGQPGACPTGCKDLNFCTVDKLVDAGSCQARCQFPPISRCLSGDRCCPRGCNAANDKDCEAVCGNGVVEPGERCDTRIPAGQQGACPTRCADDDVCTTQSLIGRGTCQARCDFPAISACLSQDGCCPAHCSAKTDSDCMPLCGNGVLDPDERCDPQIPVGRPGACPVRCISLDRCRLGSLINRGTCEQRCIYGDITQCISGDQCCPAGCMMRDNDCRIPLPIAPLPFNPLPINGVPLR